MNPKTATFDEIVDLYEKDPASFVEGILAKRRYECVYSPYCVACQSWDKITKAPSRNIIRKAHNTLGKLPWPHRFEPDTGFYPLRAMSKEQVLHHVKRLRRNDRHEDEADLLGLYYREKFGNQRRPMERKETGFDSMK